MRIQADIEGQRLSHLTALRYDRQRGAWQCRCDCGQTTHVTITEWRHRTRISCGCQFVVLTGNIHRTHGLSKTPTYRSWSAMKRRCLNPKASQYEYYGGRGIKICPQWINSFDTFVADMGQKPTRGHSIERNDNDGNYEPGNCRWATQPEQVSNSRNCRNITFQGATDTVAGWARRVNMPRSAVILRLNRGWTVERALTAPLRITSASRASA